MSAGGGGGDREGLRLGWLPRCPSSGPGLQGCGEDAGGGGGGRADGAAVMLGLPAGCRGRLHLF